MNGLSARIDGGNARRSHDDHSLGFLQLKVAQESRLARARLSREENVRIGVLD